MNRLIQYTVTANQQMSAVSAQSVQTPQIPLAAGRQGIAHAGMRDGAALLKARRICGSGWTRCQGFPGARQYIRVTTSEKGGKTNDHKSQDSRRFSGAADKRLDDRLLHPGNIGIFIR
jgi:hypothetical protein